MENSDDVAILAEEYGKLGVAADRLPCTDAFERLFETFVQRHGTTLTRAEFWRWIANSRKRGLLPRLVK